MIAMKKTRKPEWAPKNGGTEFASSINGGVKDGTPPNCSMQTQIRQKLHQRSPLTTDDFVKGVLNGNKTVLGRAITLIESSSVKRQDQAQAVLQRLIPHTGKSIRIGVSGMPGAGKSTFIEALGLYLIGLGRRVAVLAVDPSSSKSGGSILGDKTRMEKLSQAQKAFIRPSPSGGTLGGAARKTRETMLICEAAGYDVVLVETVGVGQSEITVRSMVDFFILMQIAGGGDELQGIKKGVMEISDLILINKADGQNLERAKASRHEFEMALHYMPQATKGWQSPALCCSAIENTGIKEVWRQVEKFKAHINKTHIFQNRRKAQQVEWMRSLVNAYLYELFNANKNVNKAIPEMERLVKEQKIPAAGAALKLLNIFKESISGK
jgi:LAO/AO transport system kinase